MKKIIAALVFLNISISAFGQKDKDKIEYFTDDEVKRSKFYFDAHYSPYFLDRTVPDNNFNQSPLNIILNEGAKGSYGQSFGVDFFYKLKESLHIGVGYNKSNGSYSYDFKKLLETVNLPTDTIGTAKLKTEVSFHNLPIHFVFSSRLSDEWGLDIMPTVEMNFIDKMTRTLDQDKEYFDPSDPYFGDVTENARDLNWTVGFGLGGNYYLAENFSIFFRAHVKYTLRPLIPLEERPGDLLLWIGGQTGVKFYF